MARRMRVIGLVFSLHLKQLAVDLFVIFTVIVQPLIVAMMAIYLLRDTKGFEPIFVVVGSALTGLWSGTLYFSANNIDVERQSGTLEAIVASPTSLPTVLAGKSLANTAISFSSALFGYALAVAIFGFHVTIANPAAFIASLLLAVFSILSLSLLIASFISLSLKASLWANALEFPMFILGGFLFPISLLPGWMQPVSYLLGPYWAARALHGTSSGGMSFGDVLSSWGLLVALSVTYLLLSFWLFRVFLYRARVEATLGLS